MTRPLLNCVEHEPTGGEANASIIWLHGLGANGHDFEGILPELGLPTGHGIRFVFPNAPVMPVTLNGGYRMPAWYDILSINSDHAINDGQLMESVERVNQLVDREIERGIASTRILIAGFSQGGAVGYHVALSYRLPLAGLLALSTYLAAEERLTLSEVNRALLMRVYHGSEDPIIPEFMARHSVDLLRRRGYSPHYQVYPMEHSLCWEQIQDIGAWLRERLTR